MKRSLIGIGIFCALLTFVLNFRAVNAWTQTFVGDIHGQGGPDSIKPGTAVPGGEYFSAESPKSGSTYNSGMITFHDSANDIGAGSQSDSSWNMQLGNWDGVDPATDGPEALIARLEEYRTTLFPGATTSINSSDMTQSRINGLSSGKYRISQLRMLDPLVIDGDKTLFFEVSNHFEINERNHADPTAPANTITIMPGSTLVIIGRSDFSGPNFFFGDSRIDVRERATLIIALKSTSTILRANSSSNNIKALGMHITNGGLGAFIAANNLRFDGGSTSTIYEDCSQAQIENCDARGIFVADTIVIENASSDRSIGGMFYATNDIVLQDDNSTDPDTKIYYEPGYLINMPDIGKELFFRSNTSVTQSEVAT